MAGFGFPEKSERDGTVGEDSDCGPCGAPFATALGVQRAGAAGRIVSYRSREDSILFRPLGAWLGRGPVPRFTPWALYSRLFLACFASELTIDTPPSSVVS